jgi:OmpA-OmpF porin, OOP family
MSTSNRRRSAAAIAALAGTLAATSGALAQDSLGSYALDQLDPAPAGDDFFSVHAAHTEGHLEPRALVLLSHAEAPLRLGNGESIVSHQTLLHVGGSFSLFDRLLLSVSMPLGLSQGGDSPTVNGTELTSPDGGGLGDLRFGLRARLFGANASAFQAGLGAQVYVPTARSDSFLGDGAVRVLMPQVLLSGRIAEGESVGFVWAANGGLWVRGSGAPASLSFGGAAGITLLDELVQIGPELHGAAQLSSTSPLSVEGLQSEPASRTSLELLFGAKLRPLEGLEGGLAAGPGIASGLGTPSYRLIASLAWAPRTRTQPIDPDPDGDGIQGKADACPNEKGFAHPEPAKNGCPPPDRDGDGVSDAVDACPSLKGRANDDPTRNGCPADYDRDGIFDADDACPNQKGVASVEPSRHGCPGDLDSDLDGIADRIDACPKQKGSKNEDPSKHGCPVDDGDGDGIADVDDACPSERGEANQADRSKHGCPREVRVTTGEIVILKQVRFKFGESSVDQTIDPLSDDLLTEVRDVILQHPEIEVIEVQGHADDVGTGDFNLKLSKARADAVAKWLINKGIDKKRLVARGYGANHPVAPNTTEEGRQKNRRVQFVIVQRGAPKATPKP